MNKQLKCIVIDDEPLARELIKTYVEKTPSLTLLGCFESAADAVKTVMEGSADLIFLDINMPMLNGIDFAALIPPSTRIIFVTAYDSYALQGFKVNALDYLLKPVSYSDFIKSVSRAIEWKAMSEAYSSTVHNDGSAPRMITLKVKNQLVQMRLDSIEYVEARNDRVIVFRKDSEPLPSIMTLKEIEDLLPTDTFMRVHRSFIVNIPLVEIVERNRIVFGKTYVPISENKREEFLSRLGK
ncbi:MAG: LytTR family DNA-binding domain-containing protein [Muribaculaceae bacterium]|nr:LytTR family DNA-binding domain-containing protein [Muribaculaceae bacterium]MDE6631661.1 LytTR family DNA-binding domain-containing protein [Muribaculaceae bacterium]